ncbi:MAG: sensor domain-containing phosphodiesterase [Alphaproteobacteria bacterium]|nr:sensor domain-containing phosphodiesterase [Alphaproteobacteria bacterium]
MVTALIGQISDPVVLANANGQITHFSRSAADLFGWSDKGAMVTEERLSSILREKSEFWQGLLPMRDGVERSMVLRKTYLPPGYPNGAIIGSFTAEKSEAESAAPSLAQSPTRAIFFDRLQQAILSADRFKKSVAMLLVGIDRLALVNDAMGFRAGDRLLTELAARLNHCVRASDAVTRLDGDRFGVALVIASIEDSILVAEKVFNAVSVPFNIEDRELFITVSIGISLYPADAQNQNELVKASETALHHAKFDGRNQYKFVSHDMNRRARQRLELESRLRRAIRQNEFVVFYQPKVAPDLGTVVGMEALVRWLDPERGMIGPGEFIPVAEETGLIVAIGHFVLAEACRQLAQWRTDGLPLLKLSVNVSARQFRTSTLVDEVAGILHDTGLPPELLELEITESMLMDNIEETLAKLLALRALGVGLSIDDFGTGYSSLSYLGRFPITTMKIDRAFVHDVGSNTKTAEIVRAIIGLSRGLELEVIAEGAETLEHIQFLADHGCHLVQGFYYSRPLPANEFEALVRGGPLLMTGPTRR